MNFMNRLKNKIKQSASLSTRLLTGLAKTRGSFTNALNELFSGGKRLDQEFYDTLEELLISSDVGIETTTFLIDKLHQAATDQKIRDPIQLKQILSTEIQDI